MVTQSLNVVLFGSSCRPMKLNDRVLTFVKNLVTNAGHQCTILDPKVNKLPLLEQPLHFYENVNEAPENLKSTNETISKADAFIVVTAEYNQSIPPGLSNMLDHFPGNSFAFKPVGIVSYSPAARGGACASVQLRSFFAELGALTVPEMLCIPLVDQQLDDNGLLRDVSGDKVLSTLMSELQQTAEVLMKQVSFVGSAIKHERETRSVSEIPKLHFYL